MKGLGNKYTIATLLVFTISIGCEYRNKRLDNSETKIKDFPTDRKISKANYYIENSESMFGYVSGYTEYIDVLSDLAEKPEFVEEKTPREFFFINGGDDLKITPIGKDPSDLKTKLNRTGFRCGDITKSNLNSMFQIALKNAQKDTISILISDAIYDIGQENVPLNALAVEGRETRSKFIERLGSGNLQTIIIKLHSHFEGDYFFASKRGKVPINQTRPFYIWIFGESDLLNLYFPDKYINSLTGYVDMARFLIFNEVDIPFQVTHQNKLGDFRLDRKEKNKLIDVESDRNKQGFRFSFATDFSSLPYSNSYVQSIDNYSCSGNYKITEINSVNNKLYEVNSFSPTHLISVYTEKSPYCELDISLNYVIPDWISKTNTNDDSNILNDSTHTFGFEFLTNAIGEAYSHKNKEMNIVNFQFEIAQ